MSGSITLYTKAGCGWCDAARAHLLALGFQFEEIDVRQDPAGFEAMRALSGQTLAPTLTVDGLVLADFDTGQLDQFLAEHAIRPR